MKSGIYKIVNLVNNKFYIGSSINFNRRKNGHFSKLRDGKHCNTHLLNSFRKYGEDNFKFEIVEECAIDKLIEREQWHIDNLKPHYNKRLIADSNRGIKQSPEVVAKIIESRKGFKHTKDSIKRMSEAKTGKKRNPFSEEWINNLKKSHTHKYSKEFLDKPKEKRKPIIQYDSQGDFIKEYESISQAAKVNNMKFKLISNCLNGWSTKSYGFIWKFKNK